MTALDHIRRADLDPREEEAASTDYVSGALEWVRWGISGDQPWRDASAEFHEIHREALRAGGHLQQGDVVTDGRQTAVVISGAALNSAPGGDVVWAVGLVGQDEVGLDRAINLDTGRLTKVDALDDDDRAGLMAAVMEII
ncbi:hypothetical protein E1287_39620 [Actinomadura sp. KC06]|uniref:hypothetical protein n=1 Tax=Actinomadura sp. KC06 TaxID=2530369 RepID=UPI00105171BA|nr:hypothetical protein [Actinomadura sp. KC06]TDD22656.1 hypothetical protein E1287_39620 [Actinomadura sp. KC06]